MEEVSGHCAG